MRIYYTGEKPNQCFVRASEHRALSTGHRAPSTGHRAPGTEHQATARGTGPGNPRRPKQLQCQNDVKNRAPGTGHRAHDRGIWRTGMI